jgi:hypothetical protein
MTRCGDSRRDFLKSAGLFAGALLLAPAGSTKGAASRRRYGARRISCARVQNSLVFSEDFFVVIRWSHEVPVRLHAGGAQSS